MAILRIGSRVPEMFGDAGVPGMGSPPVELYEHVAPEPVTSLGRDPAARAVEHENRSIPRVPLDPVLRRSRPAFRNPYQP
jgi:hypothetical protein